MDENTELSIRRNTAVVAGSKIEHSCAAMSGESVPVGSYLFSFDVNDPANRRMIFSIDDDANFDAEEFLAVPFNLVNWAVKKIVLTDPETGVESPVCRTVLIDNTGGTVAFVSIGVLASLDLIRIMYGDGPYDPPLKIVTKMVKTNRGFRLWKIMPWFASNQ